MKNKKNIIIEVIIVVIIAIVGVFIYNKTISKNNTSNYMILQNINKRMKEKANEENNQKQEYIKLGEIEYIVFEEHKDRGTVELISKNALGQLTLGNNDENAIGNTDLEKAIWSYNNAIETIVNYCKEVTELEIDGTKIISIRSVGNRNIKYTNLGLEGKDTTKIFKKSNIKVSKGNKIKNGDINFEKDLNRIIELDINNARNILGCFKRYLFI